MEFPVLGELFEIAIHLEERGIVNIFPMRGKDAMKRREDSGFPVDERAVTIEGEDFEAGEIEHRITDLMCERCGLRSLRQ